MAKGGMRRRKTRSHRAVDEAGIAIKDIPKSLVVKKGTMARTTAELLENLRLVMMPWTAMNLKETRDNVLHDFLSVTGVLGVSHIIYVAQRKNSVRLAIGHQPHGPCAYFNVKSYSLMKDVRKFQEVTRTTLSDYIRSPLVIMHGFKGDGVKQESESASCSCSQEEIEICRNLISGLFPPPEKSVFPGSKYCKRLVLFHQVAPGQIEWRHYGIIRKWRNIDNEKVLDIAQHLQPKASQQSSFEFDLVELGPRLSLGLDKAFNESMGSYEKKKF